MFLMIYFVTKNIPINNVDDKCLFDYICEKSLIIAIISKYSST